MLRIVLFILQIALFPLHLLAHEKSEPEAFKVDEYIMEHILDSYG
jgi:hypothetical protein